MLRAKKPESVQKRLKALFYGKAGAGKTTAAISFPAPYVIDTERGAENDQYLKLIEANGGALFQTLDFDDLLTEVKTLLTVQHPYKTLVIDPLTTLYNDLVEKAGDFLSKDGQDGTAFGRHYNLANKSMKHLLSLLLRLDMNVIITTHAKNEYSGKLEVLGVTFDCYKKLDYLFDLVLRIEKFGKERRAWVDKSRIEGFKECEFFPFSYAEIAQRYDINILEKNAAPITLAKPEQVKEIKRLIELLKVGTEITEKWLTKEDVNDFDEMKEETAQKYLDNLLKKLNGE